MKKNCYKEMVYLFSMILAILFFNKVEAKTNFTNLINIDNTVRSYEIYIPSELKKIEKLPLLIVLHGGDSSGRNMIEYTNYIPIAEKENFIVVFPDSLHGHWNDGRKGLEFEGIKDINFISNLIDDLIIKYNIDKNRVFVTGASNGGMMSLRLGCELSEKITAIASVTGSLPVDMSACNPIKKIPLLLINGTRDPLVHWEGGYLTMGLIKRGKLFSIQETFEFWAKNNQCAELSEWKKLPDKARNDGTRVYKREYTKCKNNSNVLLYKIENGGHTWSGSSQIPFQDWVVGKTSYDINASQVIWDFFNNYTNN